MSESVKLQRELRHSEERFRLLVESVADYAIFMLDPAGTIVSWNRGAERIYGYAEEAALGQHFSSFYTRADRDRRFPDYELTVAARDGRFEDEGWRIRKDGTRFWANVVITALRDEDGELVGFAKVTRDLTERVKAQGERRALEREREARQLAEELAEAVQSQAARLAEQAAALHSLNEQLQRANEALVARSEEAERARAESESANRAKADFLANVSHELRTPLNAILGYSELLQLGISGPLTAEQQAQVERIRLSGQHLLMLIDDILDFSKIEAGRLVVSCEPTRVAVPTAAALALLGPQAAERGIEIADLCGPDAERLFLGDEDRVRQVLVNLLSNAVKFTEAGGRITLRCEAVAATAPDVRLPGGGPWVCIHVEDTGVGIAAEKQEAVFDSFVQLEAGRTRAHGGTGLGLAISRRLARLMGGDVTLVSEPGRGSRFTLWLPEARGADIEADAEPAVAPGDASASRKPRRSA